MAGLTKVHGDSQVVVNVGDSLVQNANSVIINTGIASPIDAYNIQFVAGNIAGELRRGTNGTAGAVETLLIDSRRLKKHAKPIVDKLVSLGCEVVVDKKINQIFKNKFKLAKEIDWKTEYLKAKISIKSVGGVNEAKKHILKYGTMHTDGIITSNPKTAQIFLNGVNSAIAMHNVSTQFADGGEFGFGGEIGISTNKLPPRGPIGINQLTSYKYIVTGKGITRS